MCQSQRSCRSAEPVEPQNGTPKKDDITPLTLPPVTCQWAKSPGAKVLVVTTSTAFKAVDLGTQKLPNTLEPPAFLCMKKGNKLLSPVLSVSAVGVLSLSR